MTTYSLGCISSVVLETFQTYYAIFAVLSTFVHPELTEMHTRSTGLGWLIAAANARTCRSSQCLVTIISARKGTGAFDSVKDLVLEVPRLPLTRRRRFVPDFQPCGQGSLLEAFNHLTTTLPLADLTNIAN